MKNCHLKICSLIVLLIISCACAPKKEKNHDEKRPPATVERLGQGDPGKIDHSQSSDSDKKQSCLKQFFAENTPTSINALTLGAKAIQDCNAKPGDVAIFVEKNF